MLAYLIATSLLIPANLWAAITPHLHSEVSMRILHGLSTLALLPLNVCRVGASPVWRSVSSTLMPQRMGDGLEPVLRNDNTVSLPPGMS